MEKKKEKRPMKRKHKETIKTFPTLNSSTDHHNHLDGLSFILFHNEFPLALTAFIIYIDHAFLYIVITELTLSFVDKQSTTVLLNQPLTRIAHTIHQLIRVLIKLIMNYEQGLDHRMDDLTVEERSSEDEDVNESSQNAVSMFKLRESLIVKSEADSTNRWTFDRAGDEANLNPIVNTPPRLFIDIVTEAFGTMRERRWLYHCILPWIEFHRDFEPTAPKELKCALKNYVVDYIKYKNIRFYPDFIQTLSRFHPDFK